MGFIERELNEIVTALRDPRNSNRYDRLYAVQQALAWVADPRYFKRPYVSVMDIQGDSEDYSAPAHLPLS